MLSQGGSVARIQYIQTCLTSGDVGLHSLCTLLLRMDGASVLRGLSPLINIVYMPSSATVLCTLNLYRAGRQMGEGAGAEGGLQADGELEGEVVAPGAVDGLQS